MKIRAYTSREKETANLEAIDAGQEDLLIETVSDRYGRLIMVTIGETVVRSSRFFFDATTDLGCLLDHSSYIVRESLMDVDIAPYPESGREQILRWEKVGSIPDPKAAERAAKKRRNRFAGKWERLHQHLHQNLLG